MCIKLLSRAKLVFIVIFSLLMMVLAMVVLHSAEAKKTDYLPKAASGIHVLCLFPGDAADIPELDEAILREALRCGFRVEFKLLNTIAEQKQMLALIPDTDIAAVLFWPISTDDNDYREELTAIREKGIPVVLIGHDLANPYLRDSYVGCGFASERIVINQVLYETGCNHAVVVGRSSDEGGGSAYELLVLERGGDSSFEVERVQSARLQQYLDSPLTEYSLVEYHKITSSTHSAAQLDRILIATLREIGEMDVLFSLDESLTRVLSGAIQGSPELQDLVHSLIGYGRREEFSVDLESGVLSELLLADLPYSASVGLRFLNDLLLGFYVPSVSDSGIRIVMAEG